MASFLEILDVGFLVTEMMMVFAYFQRSSAGLSSEKVIVGLALILGFVTSLVTLIWTYRACE